MKGDNHCGTRGGDPGERRGIAREELDLGRNLTFPAMGAWPGLTAIIPEFNRWSRYEVMVKANTPGQLDVRIGAWLDSRLVMDFPNLRLRDVASLTIDRFALCFHICANPNGVLCQIWIFSNHIEQFRADAACLIAARAGVLALTWPYERQV